MMTSTTPGRRIKELRDQRGWSQERVAREAKLSVLTISNIEHERKSPNVKTLEAIAEALGVHPANLLR